MTDPFLLWKHAMRSGLYETAWSIADQARRSRKFGRRDDPALPFHERWVWSGEPLDDKHVVVRCYHGLGDTIQFARYLPLLGKRAASVTLEAPARLIPLLKALRGIDRIIPFDTARPLSSSPYDIEITELDLALRQPPGAVSAPYLSARRAILPAQTIALCHGSGRWDSARDIPEEFLAPLTQVAPCITLMPAPTTLPVLNNLGCPFDMEVTASLISAAKLVVTVDTMVAHLAGALGKPTWLLLKADPDWRWDPLQRQSAWYPSMRLYAQPRPGDWGSAISAVMRDLASRNGRFGEW